ncbi:BamA/TamA family outer membrane protein [Thermaurantimonas aggregans]|uniref:translocation and assembly module lipoprotein TamL n=1 Tax=Thermaurantimonas aggregans TaxID=2173829 RepID=UPI000F55B312|nr:BamA/TamA family outer membrane protein [Thermaurantimonas aggregans]MCX8149339.1 BamA/TamA family outer membrane protein [Thermaurantimonas aggregans]
MRGNKKTTYRVFLFLITVAATSWSCSTTRYVPDGQALLKKNTIQIKEKGVESAELEPIIKQQPNTRLLFLPLSLYVYNWGGLFKKIGEAPVLYNESEAYRSSQQMQLYLFNKGFFSAQVVHEKKFKNKRQNKVEVIYRVTLNEPYTVYDFSINNSSEAIDSMFANVVGYPTIKPGSLLDVNSLDQLREKISRDFRNNGFYDFTKDFITFDIDTISTPPRQASLRMNILPKPIKDGDSVRYVSLYPYKIQNVQIHLLPRRAELRTSPTEIKHRGYDLYIYQDNIFHPRVFTDAIEFQPGMYYSENRVRETFRHLNNLKLFTGTEINFRPKDPLSDLLTAEIRLSPESRQGISLSAEGSISSGQRGVSGSVSWLNRNTFGKGEIFSLSLTGLLEVQLSQGQTGGFNTLEIGAEAAITFPRFLLPFNTEGLLPKRMEPRSRLSTGIIRQQRFQFDRVVYRAGLNYQWKESTQKTHQIDLLELNYIRLFKIDPDFAQSAFLLFGFRDNFIAASRYTYTYNSQKPSYQPKALFFRGLIELAGTGFLPLIDALFDLPTDANNVSKLFGVAYAQYVKFEADIRRYYYFNKNNSLALRLFAGYTRPYGNSFDTTYAFQAPFEKRYFIGGANDLRAFRAFSIGPGTSPASLPINTAPIKLLTSLEYRFTVYKAFKSALFLDAGNIFYENLPIRGTDKMVKDYHPDQIITTNNFFSSLALGTGVGLRYDFDFFIIRVDVGIPLYNPAFASGERWISPTEVKYWVFQPGLGFPF